MSDLKKFFERDSCRGNIPSSELIDFKRACTEPEYDAYVAAAKAANTVVFAQAA